MLTCHYKRFDANLDLVYYLAVILDIKTQRLFVLQFIKKRQRKHSRVFALSSRAQHTYTVYTHTRNIA